MPIRFAPASAVGRSPTGSPIAAPLVARLIECVANDNGPATRVGARTHQPNDRMLQAALRHFAQHGLGAARVARARAEKAFFEGDRQTYDWWLGITRTLDRRLAAEDYILEPNGS